MTRRRRYNPESIYNEFYFFATPEEFMPLLKEAVEDLNIWVILWANSELVWADYDRVVRLESAKSHIPQLYLSMREPKNELYADQIEPD